MQLNKIKSIFEACSVLSYKYIGEKYLWRVARDPQVCKATIFLHILDIVWQCLSLSYCFFSEVITEALSPYGITEGCTFGKPYSSSLPICLLYIHIHTHQRQEPHSSNATGQNFHNCVTRHFKWNQCNDSYRFSQMTRPKWRRVFQIWEDIGDWVGLRHTIKVTKNPIASPSWWGWMGKLIG